MATDRNAYKRQFNKDKYKRIGLYLKPDDYERWEKGADALGMNMSAFIKQCVEKELSETSDTRVNFRVN